MKKILKTLAFTTLLLISVNSNAQFANLMARWNFSSIPPVDLGPNAIPNVSFNNLTFANGFNSIANGALHFNGTNSSLTYSHIAGLYPTSNAITIVAVVKFDGFYQGPCQASCIVSKGFPNFSSGNYQLHTTDNYFDLSCNIASPSNNQLATTIGISTIPGWVPGSYLNTSDWYLLAMTYDGTNVRYYQYIMDPLFYNPAWNTPAGLPPSATLPFTGAIGFNTQNLTIGWHSNPLYPYWLNGDLDELLIYNGALTNQSLGSLYKWLWGKNCVNCKKENEIPTMYAIENNFENIEIYPNPSDGTFNVNLAGNNITKYRVVDILGKEIIKETNINAENSFNINLLNQSKGIYFVELIGKSQKLTKKLVIN